MRSKTSSMTSCGRAPGRSILFTTTSGLSPCSSACRRTNRVWGIGPSNASTISSAPSAILSTRSTSPPKSAWPGVSMTLIFVSRVADRDVLGEDGDAALALLVVGVEHALGDLLVLAEHVGGLQQPVDQRGLAVVDVGDDGDVADVVGAHGSLLSPGWWERHRVPRQAPRCRGRSAERAAESLGDPLPSLR